MPYAIDFLNPAPDFERDRITQFYFEIVVQKMARPRHRSRAPPQADATLAAVGGDCTGYGAPRGFIGSPGAIAGV